MYLFTLFEKIITQLILTQMFNMIKIKKNKNKTFLFTKISKLFEQLKFKKKVLFNLK